MPSLQVAYYLKYDFPLKFRLSMSKLRCSAHNLLVETGRHNNIEYENRLCNLCDLSQIEDEFHFVMICHFYTTLREIYLPDIVTSSLSKRVFYSLFQDDRRILLNLSKFIYNAFKIRDERIKQLAEN